MPRPANTNEQTIKPRAWRDFALCGALLIGSWVVAVLIMNALATALFWVAAQFGWA
jgi:hypothetical protein